MEEDKGQQQTNSQTLQPQLGFRLLFASTWAERQHRVGEYLPLDKISKCGVSAACTAATTTASRNQRICRATKRARSTRPILIYRRPANQHYGSIRCAPPYPPCRPRCTREEAMSTWNRRCHLLNTPSPCAPFKIQSSEPSKVPRTFLCAASHSFSLRIGNCSNIDDVGNRFISEVLDILLITRCP